MGIFFGVMAIFLWTSALNWLETIHLDRIARASEILNLTNLISIGDCLSDELSICPVCASPSSGETVRCMQCDVPHHRDCWEYSEVCAVYGCGCALAIDPTSGYKWLN